MSDTEFVRYQTESNNTLEPEEIHMISIELSRGKHKRPKHDEIIIIHGKEIVNTPEKRNDYNKASSKMLNL